MARTGRTLTLDIGPAKRKGESRFHITKALRPKAPAAEAEAERPELTPAEARAALRRAYTRGADAAAELLAGPDMLSSDQIAERLGLSREAVLQKRRRGELLGIEGAKRGVRFPAWQVGPDGLPIAALRELHDVLGEPWAVFRFLRQQHPELGMQSGLQVAADRRRAAELVDLARSIGAFGPTGASMRAQLRNRAQNDLRRHPGKRHGAIQFAAGDRAAAQRQFEAMVLKPRARVTNRNPYFWPGASDVARFRPPHTISPGRTLDKYLVSTSTGRRPVLGAPAAAAASATIETLPNPDSAGECEDVALRIFLRAQSQAARRRVSP